MINHIRTLLGNMRASTDHALPGEEIVPAEFVPRVVDGRVRRARDVLFGGRADRLSINFRLRQILGLLHGSPALAALTLADDPRVTYLPLRDTFAAGAFGITTTVLAGTAAIYVSGESPVEQGRVERRWTVSLAGGVVTIDTGTGDSTVTPAFTAGLSDPIKLPGSALTIRIRETSAAAWRIIARARPESSLPVVLAAALASLGDVAVLRRDDDTDSQIWSIWRDGDARLRHGAWLLLLARHMERLPREGAG